MMDSLLSVVGPLQDFKVNFVKVNEHHFKSLEKRVELFPILKALHANYK